MPRPFRIGGAAEPARSAEPPTKYGATAASRSSTTAPCLRVASALPSSPAHSVVARSAGSRRSRAASQACRLRRVAPCARPRAARRRRRAPRASRGCARRSTRARRPGSGTRASSGQPAACLVSRTSSAPSASPCALLLPARFGLPRPITVRGDHERRPLASPRAPPRARGAGPATSSPSTACTCQRCASKRLATSSPKHSEVGPSMLMRLSSQR